MWNARQFEKQKTFPQSYSTEIVRAKCRLGSATHKLDTLHGLLSSSSLFCLLQLVSCELSNSSTRRRPATRRGVKCMSLGRRKNGSGPGSGQGSLGNSKVAYSSPCLNISCPTLFSEKFISVDCKSLTPAVASEGMWGSVQQGPRILAGFQGSPFMTRGCNL